MGFDLYAKNGRPDDRGGYFRNNVWWWRPLWHYCGEVAADILTNEDLDRGGWNDGHLIGSRKANALGMRLMLQIEAGDVARYAADYKARMDAVPDLPCKYCQGTGDRKDLEPPEWKEKCGGCNVCHGSGKLRPIETQYPFSEENVREFAQFCVQSKGFTIS